MYLSLTSVFIFDERWRSEAQKPTPGSSRDAKSSTAPPFKTCCMTIYKCEGSRRFYWHQRWSAGLLRGHRREAELFEQSAEVNHLNQHSCAVNGKQKRNLFRVHRFFSSVLCSTLSSLQIPSSILALAEIASLTLVPCSPLAPTGPRPSRLSGSSHVHPPLILSHSSLWLHIFFISAHLVSTLDVLCCSSLT